MSKNTFGPDIVRFLEHLAIRNKWSRTVYPSIVQTLSTGDIFLSAKEHLKFTFEMALASHQKEPVYLLAQFEIKGEHLLGGVDLLHHLGKREFKENDFKDPLRGEVFEVRRPSDVEALLKAYDSLARYFGTAEIFRLP